MVTSRSQFRGVPCCNVLCTCSDLDETDQHARIFFFKKTPLPKPKNITACIARERGRTSSAHGCVGGTSSSASWLRPSGSSAAMARWRSSATFRATLRASLAAKAAAFKFRFLFQPSGPRPQFQFKKSQLAHVRKLEGIKP